MNKATEDEARLILIELDTPGGQLSATRSMVETLLNSEIPVAVYVAPQGARAGSAGTFITAAANFAVMAPGTNIGAASPISSTGEDIPSTLAKKINEDTRAFIRSIADLRGRSSIALEETVTLARSYTANEALEKDVIDLIARDRGELLSLLDGLTAETTLGSVVVRTQDAPILEINKNLLEQFLAILANPSIAGLLISIGSLAVLIELYTPGSIGPGFVGVIMLALGFLGAGQLPLNWVALGLIALAMLLFFLEMQVPGVGIFGISGLVSFAVGLFFLFGNFSGGPDISEPGTQVSPWFIGVVVAMAAGLVFSLVYLSRPTGSLDESATLMGQEGVALSDLGPAGHVRVAGQEWVASTNAGSLIRADEGVRVVGVYANLLKVTSLAAPAEVDVGAAALVDQLGLALSDLAPTGRVQVAGNEWEATTEHGSSIAKGDPIQVVGVYANVLKVGPPSTERGARSGRRKRGPTRAIVSKLGHLGKIFKPASR